MPANSILKNRGLGIAIAVSVLIHALVLSVKFVVPGANNFRQPAPVIEVVLSGGGGTGTGFSGGGETDSAIVGKTSVVTEKVPEKVPE